MVKENSFGLIKVHTTETFSKITFMDRENTSGPMEDSTLVNGFVANRMVLVFTRHRTLISSSAYGKTESV